MRAFDVSAVLLLCALLLGAGCALSASKSEQHISKDVQEALEAGRVDEAIRIAQPIAHSSDPELVFSVGFLYLARTQVEGRTETQREADSARFLRQVERAALAGLGEASRLLEAVFRYGGYGTIPADLARADCWRSVIEQRAEAENCAMR